jgi:hypothetical protein
MAWWNGPIAAWGGVCVRLESKLDNAFAHLETAFALEKT